MDQFYPASIGAKWHGIPNNIDAALSLQNGYAFYNPKPGTPQSNPHIFLQVKRTFSKGHSSGYTTITGFDQSEGIRRGRGIYFVKT